VRECNKKLCLISFSPSFPQFTTNYIITKAGTMNANFPGFRKGVMPGHALVGVKLTAITVRLLLSPFTLCFFFMRQS